VEALPERSRRSRIRRDNRGAAECYGEGRIFPSGAIVRPKMSEVFHASESTFQSSVKYGFVRELADQILTDPLDSKLSRTSTFPIERAILKVISHFKGLPPWPSGADQGRQSSSRFVVSHRFAAQTPRLRARTVTRLPIHGFIMRTRLDGDLEIHNANYLDPVFLDHC
jgi:hypothetical protein